MTTSPFGSGRREARERGVQLVYEVEQRSVAPEVILGEQVLEPDAYTVDLVEGVAAAGPRIDEVIERLSRGWKLTRMPAMDRAVLRVGTYELMNHPEVPTAVVLNEAVELANTYSTDDSGRFVNGVLAAAAVELRA